MNYIITDVDGIEYHVEADDSRKAKRQVCRVKGVSPKDDQYGLKCLKALRKCNNCGKGFRKLHPVEVKGEQYHQCGGCKSLFVKSRNASYRQMERKKKALAGRPSKHSALTKNQFQNIMDLAYCQGVVTDRI